MTLLQTLEKNKGTVSSALGKRITRQILESNDHKMLGECIRFVCHQLPDPNGKNVRASAAKVVELVAQQDPKRIAPRLADLLPALEAPEPQTRWMVFRTLGFCAIQNPAVARKALPFAKRCIAQKSDGLCLASSVDLYLGDLGAVSKADARKAFLLLEVSLRNALPNEPDWILEACLKLLPNVSIAERKRAAQLAKRWESVSRKSTCQRARKLLLLAERA